MSITKSILSLYMSQVLKFLMVLFFLFDFWPLTVDCWLLTVDLWLLTFDCWLIYVYLLKLSFILQEPFIRFFYSFFQSNFRFPACVGHFRNIHQFAWCSIRFGAVPDDFAFVPDDALDYFCQLFDRKVCSAYSIVYFPNDANEITFIPSGRR